MEDLDVLNQRWAEVSFVFCCSLNVRAIQNDILKAACDFPSGRLDDASSMVLLASALVSGVFPNTLSNFFSLAKILAASSTWVSVFSPRSRMKLSGTYRAKIAVAISSLISFLYFSKSLLISFTINDWSCSTSRSEPLYPLCFNAIFRSSNAPEYRLSSLISPAFRLASTKSWNSRYISSVTAKLLESSYFRLHRAANSFITSDRSSVISRAEAFGAGIL
mmetsp:Transcript_129/g.225  ORF Transcript_129/g.225 Transcript_129/m.225 type:complete len:220 (+) Transcript_129:157-816(+)